MKRTITILAILFGLFTIGNGQTTTYEDKISLMFELSGTKKNFDSAIDAMINIQKSSYGNSLDDEFINALSEEMKRTSMEDLVPMLIPVYKKYLTEEHLDGIIEFYKTDAGKALNEKNPMIMTESMQIGAEWGKKIAMKVSKRIDESFNNDFEIELEEDCSKFRNGEFEEISNRFSGNTFSRNGDKQIELLEGVTMEFKITWVSNNKYTLSYIGGTEEKLIDDVTVNIYEVNGNSYKYIVKDIVGNFERGEVMKLM